MYMRRKAVTSEQSFLVLAALIVLSGAFCLFSRDPLTAVPKLRFAKIYSVPDDARKPAAFALADTKYEVIDIQWSWIKIRFGNADLWGKALDFDLSGESPAATEKASTAHTPVAEKKMTGRAVKIHKHLTKLRVGPDEKCKIITFLFENKDYPLVAETDNYYRIKYEDTSGYIMKSRCILLPVKEPTTKRVESVLARSPDPENTDILSTSGRESIPAENASSHRKRPARSLPPPDRSAERSAQSASTANTPPSHPQNKAPQHAMNDKHARKPSSQTGNLKTEKRQRADSTRDHYSLTQTIAAAAQKAIPAARKNKILYSAITGIGIISFGLFALLFVMSRKRRKKKKGRRVVIIGDGMLSVKMSLLKRSIPIERFFQLRGYGTRHFDKFKAGGIGIIHSTVDILLIDWKLRKDAQKCIEQIQDATVRGPLKLCLFYGVPPGARTKKYKLSDAFSFTGNVISVNSLAEMLPDRHDRFSPAAGTAMSVERYPFQGEIDGESLSEMLQFILITKKSGSLIVESRECDGTINFTEGTIVHAETASSSNQAAVREMLDLKNGEFRFVTSPVPLKQTTHIDVMNVMMEWAQFKDEKVIAS
ncbi:MAG: DUF4388 domain-containing protein [Chitinivibrionales bacterium]|nr:DUF4388 domain-containing protein [Chitinivibrionales bacterium]